MTCRQQRRMHKMLCMIPRARLPALAMHLNRHEVLVMVCVVRSQMTINVEYNQLDPLLRADPLEFDSLRS